MKNQNLSTISSSQLSDESVRVVVQARPLLPFETAHNANVALTTTTNPPVVTLTRPLTNPAVFQSFDAVYSLQPHNPPDSLYDNHVSSLVDGLFNGFNATVFAYGQTSAGKSYTMSHVTSRVASQLFHNKILSEKNNKTVSIRIGFVEIYRERIRDLVDGARAPLGTIDIQVRERRSSTTGNREVFLDGARERPITDESQLIDLVKEACLVRQTAATGMNASSSRSHSVITITVYQTDNNTKSDSLAAKLHLVDLAGSERAKRTATSGTRFAEGVHINQGLFALAKVISALATNANKKKKNSHIHIPYRDSKLTRLLQDSLGGNARTLLVACVSPADTSCEETLGTLRYAQQAKCIRNKPKVNTEINSVEVSDLRAALARAKSEIASLVTENERLRGHSKLSISQSDSNLPNINQTEQQQLVHNLKQRIHQLEDEVNHYRQNSPDISKPISSPHRLTSSRSPPYRPRRILGAQMHENRDDSMKDMSTSRISFSTLPRRRTRVCKTNIFNQTDTKNSAVVRANSLRLGHKHMDGNDTDCTDEENPNTTKKVRFGERSKSELSLSRIPTHQQQLTFSRKAQRPKRMGVSSADSFLNTYDTGGDYREDLSNESTLNSNVVNVLSANRMMEMRRTFTERLRQTEMDKATIDGQRTKLLHKISALEQQHQKEIDDLKTNNQSRLGEMRKKLADVKKLEAESTRLMKLRDYSDAEQKKLLSRVKAAEKAKDEVVSKLADVLNKSDLAKRSLGKENKELTRSERQLRTELARRQAERMKQTAIISRLRLENEAMRNRLRAGQTARQQVRRTNSSITPRALAHTTTSTC